MLTLEKAHEILPKHISEPHLLNHALAVSSAMGALAEHFGEDAEHWRAIGYLHDIDFEKFPTEHLQHTRAILEPEGVDAADIRAILAHGWGLCYDVEPLSKLEKSLYAVDELTGIVMATALMRPTGITDLEVKSVTKKFKDKRFAAKCNRDVIRAGAELLEMELDQLISLTIKGMQSEAAKLGLTGGQ